MRATSANPLGAAGRFVLSLGAKIGEAVGGAADTKEKERQDLKQKLKEKLKDANPKFGLKENPKR